MPGIEELHFEVVLDKDKFLKDIDAIQKVAANLNNTLTNSLNLTKSVGSGISGMVAPQTQYTQAVEKTNTALNGTSNIMRTISQLTGVAFGVVGLRRFTAELIQTAGAFEVQKAALSSMLQDAEKAGEIFDTLRQKALESPYTFQDLTKFAKQLIAFNIPADQLVETERRLADVAAGLGVDMGRIILAYGQVKAAGALKGQELRQFTEAGVPILEQLAKQIEEVEGRTVSLSEVFNRVTKKQIPFEMVEEAFKRMTDEGGKFYNMQAVLVETLQGKISKLRDVWQQVLYDLGMENEGILKGAVDLVTELVQHLDELGKRIPQLIAMWGAYKVAQVAAEVATGNFALANHGLLNTLVKIGAWIAKNPYAILAAAVAGVTIEAIRFGKQMYDDIHREEIAQKQLNAALKEASTNITAERTALKELAMVAGDELKTMDERQRAIDAINTQYGEYLKNLGIEKVSIDNLGTAYDKLTTAIGQKYLAELKEQTVGSRTSALADARTALVNYNADFLKKHPITWRGKTDMAGPGGVGKILGEIEAMLINHPLFDEEAATNAIANIYNRYGVRIKAGSDEAGDLYRVASDYVMAARLLRNSESDFKNFADAYGLAIGGDKKTAAQAPNQWGNDWNPVGGNKSELKMPFIDIDKAMEEVDKELIAILAQDTKELDAELDKRFKAMKSFDDFIRNWQMTKNVPEGEGAGFKLTNIIGDYKEKDAEILSEYTDRLRELGEAWGEGTATFESKKDDLDDWFDTMNKINRSKTVEKIRKLGPEFFNELMSGYDLTNLNDKTLTQIEEIRDAIKEIELPVWVKEYLMNNGFLDALDKLEGSIKKKAEDTDEHSLSPAEQKEVTKYVSKTASFLGKAANHMKELAKASGNVKLEEFAEAVSGLSNIVGSVAAAYQTGGVWGAFIAGGISVFDTFIEKATEAETQARALRDSIRDIAYNSDLQRVKDSLADGVDTMFGENAVRDMINAVKAMDDAQKKASQMYSDAEKYWSWLQTQKGIGRRSIMLESASSTLPDNLAEMLIRTDKDNWATLAQLAAKMRMKVFDENGFLNPDFLAEIEKLYGAVNEEFLGFLKSATLAANENRDANDRWNSSIKELFGELSLNMTDEFIDNFKRMGNAVDDLGDTFTNLGETILRSLLQSFVLDEILTKYEESANVALSKYARGEMTPDDYAAWLDKFTQQVQEDSDALAPAINGLIEAFYNRGLINMDSEDANSIGSGIKSITEETASLLASYINAMRADLSYIRGLQEKGWLTVDAIGGAIPTLNDYLNQIAGNTADSALRAQEILNELRSVIGTSGSDGLVVRVAQA